MPFYESTFIVRPDASPQQVETLAEEVEGFIKERGGAVPNHDAAGIAGAAAELERAGLAPRLMIDASHIKVHPHAAGAQGGNQAMNQTKGGSIPRYIWPWMRMAIRSESLLQRFPPLIAHRLTR